MRRTLTRLSCGLVATLLLAHGLASANAASLPQADEAFFQAKLAPLLKTFCLDCHGPDDPEGNLSLDEIDPDLLNGADYETWRLIDEQIRFGDMPPDDAEQLSDFSI